MDFFFALISIVYKKDCIKNIIYFDDQAFWHPHKSY